MPSYILAENGERFDVVFMDPPRSGSSKKFIDSLAVAYFVVDLCFASLFVSI